MVCDFNYSSVSMSRLSIKEYSSVRHPSEWWPLKQCHWQTETFKKNIITSNVWNLLRNFHSLACLGMFFYIHVWKKRGFLSSFSVYGARTSIRNKLRIKENQSKYTYIFKNLAKLKLKKCTLLTSKEMSPLKSIWSSRKTLLFSLVSSEYES